MIEFPCLCGVKFSLADELAGTSLQCTACGRLVSVPTLDDLKLLNEDGTYDVDMHVGKLATRVAKPGAMVDAAVDEDDVGGAIPLDDFEIARAPAPRYDPFTGELIRAVDVNAAIDTPVAKAAPRVQPLNKSANRGKQEEMATNSWLRLLAEMFMARNVTVLVLMWVLHVAIGFILFLVVGTGAGMVLVPVPAILGAVALGYYSLVVQETGPGELDEIPTPLRSFEFKYDIWDPIVHFVLSAVPCFAPSLFVLSAMGNGPRGITAFSAALMVGAFFFPAVFMTAAVDGVLANFRPDRVIGAIWVAGLDYLPVFISWTLGAALVLDGEFGILGKTFPLTNADGDKVQMPFYVLGSGPSMIMIAVGLYLSYYACWVLGHVWRKYHTQFPWVGQVFIKPKPELGPHIKRSKA